MRDLYDVFKRLSLIFKFYNFNNPIYANAVIYNKTKN